MKHVKEKTFRCVHGNTAEDFEARMNDALKDMTAPDITYSAADPYTAYILATVYRQIPETIADEYELRGETYQCQECPYFERTNDMRRKWHYCRFHEETARQDAHACAEFYQQLEFGTLPNRKGGKRWQE